MLLPSTFYIDHMNLATLAIIQIKIIMNAAVRQYYYAIKILLLIIYSVVC